MSLHHGVGSPTMRLSVAVTGRPWADRLHRHVQDHGGGRVVARLLSAEDALEADTDVVLLDDVSSFLSVRLVAELQGRGRVVVGVFDPDEPDGGSLLRAMSADLVVPATIAPGPLLEQIRDLPRVARGAMIEGPATQAHGERRDGPRRIGVLGPRGAQGVTETAFGLATLGGDAGHRPILVDLDLDLPSVAPRAGLELHPHLGDAIESVVHGRGSPAASIQQADGVAVVAGLPPGEGPRAFDVDRVLAEMPSARVVVDLGVAPWPVEDPRRRLLTGFDAFCLAVAPTPNGVVRAVEVATDLDLPPERTAIVVAQAPRGRRVRAELASGILATFPAAACVFVPFDRRLAQAAWNGDRLSRGRAARGLRPLASVLLGPGEADR